MKTSRRSTLQAMEKDNDDLFNENLILRRNLDEALKVVVNRETVIIVVVCG